MPARLKNLAQIVGAAAQAELDAVKPASRDHAQDDRDRAFNRAVELLQWFEASCTRPERQSAGRTESVVALVSALASAARSAPYVEDVFLTEAARLWLAADAGPHRSTAAVQQFGTEIARQVSTRTSSDPPGTRHTGRPLAQELLLAVVRARQPGRDHQDQQSLSSLLVEEVNSEIRAALAADGDSARLDFFPVHLLREPIGCLGTPLEQVERSVLGTGDRSREWGLKWYATLLDLQAAPWFPALLPRQRAIITEVLAARGLPYGAEDWREWLTGEPAFQAIPMDAAVRELVSLVDDLERAFSRGAILGAHDARGLLQSSRRLLELQLWVDPKQRPAITPREPASLEMRDQRYWILLLQELQTGGLTLEWGRDGWRVFRHLTPEFEAVRLLPGHPPGGITMRVDATDGQRSEHVLPLLGISADQLVDVLSHLAHRTRASER